MGNRIRELRVENKISQKQLARDTGISQASLSQYEKAGRNPKIEAWQELADYFGVSVGYLQGIEEEFATDEKRQERWNEREQIFIRALRESYMLNGSWEDLAQTFKREWHAHELEERIVQNDDRT